jgi:type I restriction enzyme S subunit
MSEVVNIPQLRFSEFSDEWEEKKFVDISIKITDGTHFSPNVFNKGDFLYITSKNVKNGHIDFTNISYVTKEDHKAIYRRCDVRFGDVLLTKDGTIGQACVNTLREEFSLLSSVALIRLNSLNSNGFLYQLIVSPTGQKEIDKSIAGQALKRITLAKIKDFKNFFPTKPEQQKIAAFLTEVDNKIEQLSKKQELLGEYKKGLMQKIFSQAIRFKTDDGSDFPDWEEKKLGGVGRVKKGSQLNKSELTNTGDYPAINGGINPSGYTDKWNTGKNTITISEGGNSCGYINFITSKFWSGGHCYSIEELKGDVLNRFLFQYLKFNEHLIMRLRVGSGLPNIQKGEINNFKVNLPSLEEQTKISNFLSYIDNKIEQVDKQLDESKQFKKALLQQMFI